MNQTKHILFLCPHGAAKSVLAMTYFTSLANDAGLEVVARNAGTEPDPAINPKVERHLQSEGFNLTGFKPPRLSEADLAWSDVIVSIGCITPDQAPSGKRFLDWSDVPMLNEDFQKSRDAIYNHVTALIKELKGR